VAIETTRAVDASWGRLYSGIVKPALVIILAGVVLLSIASAARAQEAIYLVRHAERANQSADSPLSTAGVRRANRLRDMLKDAGITRIFTSELRRTIETAAPLASAIDVSPQQIPGDVDALAAKIAASNTRDRVLVVGHSNTLPALLHALHVEPPIAIADDAFDNLFIVVLQNDGRPLLLRLKY
jgi:broad specificity phosphatase PhoE